MAGWRGTCRALNWVCMLYRWLAGALVMIAVSRWPWWQLHAGRPRPACLFLSGPGTLSRQLLSPVLITPSCPPCYLATLSQPLHTLPPCSHNVTRSHGGLLPHRPAMGKKDECSTTSQFYDTTYNTSSRNNVHQNSMSLPMNEAVKPC